MQGFNHVAGGVAFTGIFASFTNVNIFEKPEYIAVTVLASVAADIDHTRSLIGKIFFPVAKWINNKFGHRTITHSLIFYLGILLVLGTLESFFNFSRAYFIITAFAYGSHIIFDMCTKQGVPVFWPFTRRPAVLPGNPNLRLSVNDFRSEAIVFLVFCSLTFFCLPLMANGFWVSYRKYFLTSDNIKKEFLQSDDYLNIYYSVDGTSKVSTLLEIQGGKFIFLTNNQLETVAQERIKLVDFQHTKRPKKTEVFSIFQSTPDSLRMLIKGKIIRSGQIQSNIKIQYFDNAIMKESNTVSIDWKQNFDFFMIDTTRQDGTKMAVLSDTYQKEISRYRELKSERERIKLELVSINSASDLSDYETGKAINRRKELEKIISAFQPITLPSRITLDAEIKTLKEPTLRKYVSANLIIQIL